MKQSNWARTAWPFFKWSIGMMLGLCLTLWAGQLTQHRDSAIAQTPTSSLRPEYVSNIVYQRLPDFPKENQYTRKSTRDVDPENTLVTRFIRYHQDVQKRPVRYRFDWKLTFADYLGKNEPVKEERYPGKVSLTDNPYKRDLEVINSLNRRQRNDLVNVLASIYNPPVAKPDPSQPSTQPTPQPSAAPTPQRPNFSQPGDSQLLKP